MNFIRSRTSFVELPQACCMQVHTYMYCPAGLCDCSCATRSKPEWEGRQIKQYFTHTVRRRKHLKNLYFQSCYYHNSFICSIEFIMLLEGWNWCDSSNIFVVRVLWFPTCQVSRFPASSSLLQSHAFCVLIQLNDRKDSRNISWRSSSRSSFLASTFFFSSLFEYEYKCLVAVSNNSEETRSKKSKM